MDQHFTDPSRPLAAPSSGFSRVAWAICLVIVFAVVSGGVIILGSIAPADFPSGAVVSIKNGSTLDQAAGLLAESGVIRSAFLYKAYSVLLERGTTGVKTGDYLFDAPQSALRVAYRTARGIEGLPRVKVTIPEGSDSADMAKIISKAISGFDALGFSKLARSDEGYLFPDTYLWPTNVKPDRVIDDMKSIFDAKIQSIQSDLSAFGKPLKDVVAMASIAEKEATSSADRRIVAGILWKRLAAGMALQVDPPFYYFLDKRSDQLSLDDLKIESPYNLYLNTGLPPSPIDSPGLEAILDAVHPTATSYWFYLSGKDGSMHYAATLDGHNANKTKYLN
jgi:UPF0755 protein